MVKVDALQVHLKSLSSGGAMLPLYVFSGDEPLLMMEAIDQAKPQAKGGSGEWPLPCHRYRTKSKQ